MPPQLSHGHTLSRPETRTDLLTRFVRMTRDPPCRVRTQPLPDLRACPEPVEGEIHTTYDVDGNVVSITPPSRLAHTFESRPIVRSSIRLPARP